MKTGFTRAEILVSVVVAVALILICDSYVRVHPIDSSRWAGEHNNLGRWIPGKNLRAIELVTGLVMLVAVPVVCVLYARKKKHREQPNEPLEHAS